MKRSEIEALLPGIFQRAARAGAPLTALLDVMETLHVPDETLLAELDCELDPRRARAVMVRYLAHWVDLDRLFGEEIVGAADPSSRDPISTGMGRLRELVAAAAYLSQWRGTARGLLRFLQVATGSSDFEVDEQPRSENGEPRPFHVRVRAPAAAQPHRVLLERIIEGEKPAYVTYELRFGNDA